MRKQRTEGKSREGEGASRVLRPAGRLAIWVAIGVLLVRGAVATFAAPQRGEVRVTAGTGDQTVPATAERFARLYLEDPSRRRSTPTWPPAARVGAGRPPPPKASRSPRPTSSRPPTSATGASS